MNIIGLAKSNDLPNIRIACSDNTSCPISFINSPVSALFLMKDDPMHALLNILAVEYKMA